MASRRVERTLELLTGAAAAAGASSVSSCSASSCTTPSSTSLSSGEGAVGSHEGMSHSSFVASAAACTSHKHAEEHTLSSRWAR